MKLPLFALLLALIAWPAFADQAKPADLTPEDRAELDQIQTYLNGISTLTAHFTQIGIKGEASGTFYLDRPGKLRFEYQQPQKDLIVAERRGLIWYYDARQKEANHAPVSRTVADFLLRQTIDLSGGDVTVTDFEHEGKLVLATLAETGDPGAGSLTLMFTERPLQIIGWRVVDAQRRTTEVTLDDTKFGMPLDSNLFVYKDPE